ncbi:MAG TPA: hypothetical protein PKM63_06255 [Panacibacter sp.]|nr:hypothetical protein [Panacibacter sp.]HNP43869.1 hypothetical protein [Panacibacter sp.]
MKKLSAILLLIIFLFNTIGYRLLINFVQNKTDEAMEARLDRGNYDDNELLAIRIPVNMPYQTSQSGYERVNGEINFEGKVYKYVKRIVQNDTMTLLCIPHEEKAKLQQSANNYFGGVNDLAGNTGNSSKKADAVKQLLTEFEDNQSSRSEISGVFEKSHYLYNSAAYPQQFFPLHGQPPEYV